MKIEIHTNGFSVRRLRGHKLLPVSTCSTCLGWLSWSRSSTPLTGCGSSSTTPGKSWRVCAPGFGAA